MYQRLATRVTNATRARASMVAAGFQAAAGWSLKMASIAVFDCRTMSSLASSNVPSITMPRTYSGTCRRNWPARVVGYRDSLTCVSMMDAATGVTVVTNEPAPAGGWRTTAGDGHALPPKTPDLSRRYA